MAFKLNAATRLTADENSEIAPAEGFREKNEDGLAEQQKENRKSNEENLKEPTEKGASTEIDAEEEGGDEEGEEGGGGDTTITMDLPQSNEDDDVSVDAAVLKAANRLKASLEADEEEVDADNNDSAILNQATPPMGPMA